MKQAILDSGTILTIIAIITAISVHKAGAMFPLLYCCCYLCYIYRSAEQHIKLLIFCKLNN